MAFGGRTGLVKALALNWTLKALDASLGFRPTGMLIQYLRPPGSGPSERSMDAGSFEARVRGRDAQGQRAEVVVKSRGDPANRVTVMCACESALALATDDAELPARWGVLTSTVALGQVLARRLQVAGMMIETRDLPSQPAQK